VDDRLIDLALHVRADLGRLAVRPVHLGSIPTSGASGVVCACDTPTKFNLTRELLVMV
jgi:hypothetical protein